MISFMILTKSLIQGVNIAEFDNANSSIIVFVMEFITVHFIPLVAMASIRQEKIAGLIQKELSQIFRKEARTICMGAMVSVTVVRMSPDMGLAKAYLSIFGSGSKDDVFKNIELNNKVIRHELSKSTKNQLRRTPELMFFLDDSLDYAAEIDKILKDN